MHQGKGLQFYGGMKIEKKKYSKINIDVSPLKCKIILIKKCIILNINILFQLRCLKGQWQTYIHNYISSYNNTEWKHMFIIKKQDNSNYLNDNMLQQVGCVWQHDRPEELWHLYILNVISYAQQLGCGSYLPQNYFNLYFTSTILY